MGHTPNAHDTGSTLGFVYELALQNTALVGVEETKE